jgi:hypothetical protein
MLYACNTIILRMPECALYLDRVLLPQRINEIRSLELQWYVGEPPVTGSVRQEKWSRIWGLIATMESLMYAHIELHTLPKWQHSWSRDEARLLDNVRFVTLPKKFKLCLMWPKLEGSIPLQLPCEISRISWAYGGL